MACDGVTQLMDSDTWESQHSDTGVSMDPKHLWATLQRQHSEILHKLDKHFANQQELFTQALGKARTYHAVSKAACSAHKHAEDQDESTSRQDNVDEQAWNDQCPLTEVMQLPGSTELLPVVPEPYEPLPMPESSAVWRHWTSSGSRKTARKSHREHLQTLRKKIQQRLEVSHNELASTPLHKQSFLAMQFQRSTDRYLLRLLNSGWFDACSFVLIVIFTVYITAPLTYEAGCSPKRPGHIAMDVVFCVFFILELALRVAPYGLQAFRSHDWFWNLFDAVVVCFSVSDIVVALFTDASSMLNPLVFRILRVSRVVSTLHVVRMFTMFRELRLLVHSVWGCLRSLAFSLVILFVFIVFCGTLLTMGSQSCLHQLGQQDSQSITNDFGTLGRSCITLFMAICGGADWGDAYKLLGTLGWEYQLIYITYVSFTVFGLVNVFTGVFVDHAMQASNRDRENQIRNQIQEEDHNLKELQKVFMELDLNHSGRLSLEEFESHLNDERALAYFQAVKLDVTDIGHLFSLLDADGSGSVEIEEFIEGCQRLKGESRNLDIKIALLELQQLRDDLQKFSTHNAQQLSQLSMRSNLHN